MLSNKHLTFTSVFLVIILCLSLANVNSALADDGTPTEPSAVTEIPTETAVVAEPTVESTPVPVEATSTPEPTQDTPAETPAAAEDTSVTELLSEISDNTDLVVLDENGEALSLASQDAAEIIQVADPIWCPEGQTPTIGLNGCTPSFASIFDLLNDMEANPGNYAQNGVIYLEQTRPSNPATTITSAVVIDNSTYSNLFTNLSIYNLTLQGGWNPNWNPNNPNSPMINGQTDFLGAGAYLQIGSSSNPWVGNVTLNDIKIGVTGPNGGASTNAGLTIYTTGTNGDISLNNVDVRQQEGNNYTAYLQSTNGDINLGPSIYLVGPNALINTFDGNNASGEQNLGFSATTTTGSISISDTRFQDAFQTGSSVSANGAALSAPTITLTNVIAFDNDGNGLSISNANTVTLNNVTGGKNNPGQGNGLSGVYVNGTGSTTVNVNAGTFNFNGQYGIELINSILNEQAAPTCTGNGLGTIAEPCYNTASSTPTNTPTATPTNTPANTPTNTPANTPTATPTNMPVNPPTHAPMPTATSGGATSQLNGSGGSGSLIPVTGGESIKLDCLTTINLFDITVTFFNLCDYQAGLNSLNAGNLPGQLPDGASFVMGLDVLVFNQDRVIQSLPDGTGIQMDFSLPDGSQDQFATLYWNDEDGDGNGEWIEISQQINGDKLSQIMSADPADELYHISATAADANLYKILTTEKTGTFVLVKK
jgi:hypothetical protein